MGIQDVVIESGIRLLPGRLWSGTREPEQRRILFVHGYQSTQTNYALRAQSASADLAAICLTFDLSGHGRDAARLSSYAFSDHIDDVIAAYDYLAMLPPASNARIGVCGASYGGYLAAVLTAHRSVKRLILRATPLASGVASTLGLPSSHGLPDSLGILSRYTGDTLIIESELDCVVPHDHIAAYLASNSTAQHMVIPGATHALTDPAWDKMFVGAMIEWFRGL